MIVVNKYRFVIATLLFALPLVGHAQTSTLPEAVARQYHDSSCYMDPTGKDCFARLYDLAVLQVAGESTGVQPNRVDPYDTRGKRDVDGELKREANARYALYQRVQFAKVKYPQPIEVTWDNIQQGWPTQACVSNPSGATCQNVVFSAVDMILSSSGRLEKYDSKKRYPYTLAAKEQAWDLWRMNHPK